MVPFLKWPGGKRWFIAGYTSLLPTDFDRYIEPFLGGGSVFFHLEPDRAILSDTNDELIGTDAAIRDHRARLEAALRRHHARHSEGHYYRVRDSSPESIGTRAARMIYLNRTCFNGIYRVNRDGRFNVPKGTKSSVILDTDDFTAAARLLAAADLRTSDFEPVIDEASEGDFVFADPPYTVSHNNNGFVKYSEKLFSWGEIPAPGPGVQDCVHAKPNFRRWARMNSTAGGNSAGGLNVSAWSRSSLTERHLTWARLRTVISSASDQYPRSNSAS